MPGRELFISYLHPFVPDLQSKSVVILVCLSLVPAIRAHTVPVLIPYLLLDSDLTNPWLLKRRQSRSLIMRYY